VNKLEIIRLIFWLLIALITGITILGSVYFATNKEDNNEKVRNNKKKSR
jgi:hypothetical protein